MNNNGTVYGPPPPVPPRKTPRADIDLDKLRQLREKVANTGFALRSAVEHLVTEQ